MNKRYEELFSDCCRMTPIKPDDVAFWRASGPWTIFIRRIDGSEYEYNGLDQTIHVLWQTDNEQLTDEETLVKFGYVLGRKMRSAGYDAISLSAATGISQASIYRYMSGKGQPTYLNLMKLSKVLHCSIGEFGYFI